MSALCCIFCQGDLTCLDNPPQHNTHNITRLLESEGCTWHNIVRTSCYLRDIDRDYDAFNIGRTKFFKEQGIEVLPASTGIQAHLCRPELLIEIEAIAMFRTKTDEK